MTPRTLGICVKFGVAGALIAILIDLGIVWDQNRTKGRA